MKKLLCPIICLLILCGCTPSYKAMLDDAEKLIFTDADSTLHILELIPYPEIEDEEERSTWALLESWALYRTYAKEIPVDRLEAAYQYFTKSDNNDRKAEVCYLRSVVREDQKVGSAEEWRQDLYDACLAVKGSEQHMLASRIYQCYGGKLYELHKYDEAVEWHKLHLEEAQIAGDVQSQVTAYIDLSLSQVYAENERVKKKYNTIDGVEIASHTQFEEGIATIFRGLALARKHQLTVDEGKIYGDLAIFYSYCQRSDSALHYALLAKDIDEKEYAAGRRKERVRYLHVCDAYRKAGMADSAIYYGMRDIDNPSLITRTSAAQLLSLVYDELKHDDKTSRYWLQQRMLFEDSLRMQRTGDFASSERSAVTRKHVAESAIGEARRSRHWLLFTFVTLAATIIFGTIVIKRNRKRFRAQLKVQEDEINRLINEKKANEAKTVTQQESTLTSPPAVAEQQQVEKKQSIPTADGCQDESVHEGSEAVVSPVHDAKENLATDGADTPSVSDSTSHGVASPSVHATPPSAKAELPLRLSGSTKEEVNVMPDKVLYLTSEGNYIKVVYIQADGRLTSKLLRQTMTGITAELEGYPSIVRCHRAYFVNLQHVHHASSIPSGLELTLDASSASIPVSRSYIAGIKARLLERLN